MSPSVTPSVARRVSPNTTISLSYCSLGVASIYQQVLQGVLFQCLSRTPINTLGTPISLFSALSSPCYVCDMISDSLACY